MCCELSTPNAILGEKTSDQKPSIKVRDGGDIMNDGGSKMWEGGVRKGRMESLCTLNHNLKVERNGECLLVQTHIHTVNPIPSDP